MCKVEHVRRRAPWRMWIGVSAMVLAGAGGGVARAERVPVPCKSCPDIRNCDGCRDEAKCPQMSWLPRCPPPAPPPPVTEPPPPKVVKKPAKKPAEAVMVRVPEGCFDMGSADGADDEKPVHKVCLSAFEIDRDEVTNAEYRRCVDAGGCAKPESYGKEFSGPRQPVVGVSWKDAVAYCRFAGKELPTEAQWEYAARGTDGRTYPWGSTITCADANYGWISDECKGKNPAHPVDVGSYRRNVSPFGARDMAGNVWEWVRDSYDAGFYGKSSKQDPFSQGKDADAKILRGGSWFNIARSARAANRGNVAPSARNLIVGFRCSRVVR